MTYSAFNFRNRNNIINPLYPPTNANALPIDSRTLCAKLTAQLESIG